MDSNLAPRIFDGVALENVHHGARTRHRSCLSILFQSRRSPCVILGHFTMITPHSARGSLNCGKLFAVGGPRPCRSWNWLTLIIGHIDFSHFERDTRPCGHICLIQVAYPRYLSKKLD